MEVWAWRYVEVEACLRIRDRAQPRAERPAAAPRAHVLPGEGSLMSSSLRTPYRRVHLADSGLPQPLQVQHRAFAAGVHAHRQVLISLVFDLYAEQVNHTYAGVGQQP